MKTRKALLLPLLAAAAAVAVPAAVHLGYLRLEVPRQHWFYFLPRGPRPGMIWPMLAVALMLGLLWAALRWRGKVEPWKVLAAAVVCCYLCAVGTRASTKMGFTTLASTVLFDGSNSYFTTATETPDPLALARDYPAQMPRLRLHAATQSPGTFLLHAALRRFFLNCPSCMALAEVLLWLNPCHRASEVTTLVNPVWGSHFQPPEVLAALLIALLFPLILALGVIPTFALARRLGGERPALVIVALYAVTPSFIWFTAAVDQIYPTIAALTLLLVHCGVRHRTQWLPLVGAGLLTGLAIFASFGYSVIALAAALFIALLTSFGCRAGARTPPAVLRESKAAGYKPPATLTSLRPTVRVAVQLGLYGAGVALVLAIIQFGLGIDLVGVARVSGELRTRLYLHDLPRPWLTWVLLNPIEFTLGLGFSTAALVIAALVVRRSRRDPALVLLSATLVALALLDLSGAARAEWSRMLMMAMPLCLIGAGGAVRRLRLYQPAPAVILIASQAVYALVCFQLFEVWGAWIVPFD
ncbi:MAG: hypothetical protein ABFD94_16810 [Armatimonadia bacterium]